MVGREYICIKKCDMAYFYNFCGHKIYGFYIQELYTLSSLNNEFFILIIIFFINYLRPLVFEQNFMKKIFIC